jgi:hypothetical protein
MEWSSLRGLDLDGREQFDRLNGRDSSRDIAIGGRHTLRDYACRCINMRR